MSLADGEPPQAKAGKTVGIAAQGFKKTAVSEGVSRGIANQVKNVSKVSNEAKKTYYSKTSKNKAYERANGLCEYCGKKTQKDTPYKKDLAEGDHFIPQSQGGKTTKENLANACAECNGG
ncbi:HNH endonuclease [Acinetobacter baumannii]|uniref:HNH endonuclease n=1 Tax=Acinetobacter baumannii TaxID=470 RepID=UPI003AF48229